MGVVGFGSCIPSELRKMAVIMVRREESRFNLRALLPFMRSGDYKRAQIWCESIMSNSMQFPVDSQTFSPFNRPSRDHEVCYVCFKCRNRDNKEYQLEAGNSVAQTAANVLHSKFQDACAQGKHTVSSAEITCRKTLTKNETNKASFG